MDRSIFAVVGDRPDAGCGLYQRLVAVIVKLWCEVINGGVLVERIGCVDGICATLERGFAVADLVKVIGIAIV